MKTPHLDALASSGVRFEHAYSTQPVCGPARSCLFTGLFPHENGILGNSMPLGADVRTLGERLTDAGIHCAYIGKWHLDGGDYFGNGICPPGFDPAYWYDMKCYLDELPDDEARMRSRRRSASLDGEGIDASFTYGHRVASRAISFIQEHAGEDFFLVVSFDEPHGPSLCPRPYAQMYQNYEMPDTPAYADDLSSKPAYQQLWAETCDVEKARRPALLLGCNSFIDSEIGRILDAVHALLPEATLMYTSDHGESCGAHGLNHKGPAVYDEIARIPLIFSGPEFPAGVLLPHTVSHADIPATILHFMGLPVPPSFTGRNLLPCLQSGRQEEEGLAFIEFNRYERDHDGFGGLQLMRGIITDRFKFAMHLLDTDELYDIEKDPFNIHNLINDPAFAEVRNTLQDRVLAWMNDTRDPFRGYQWQCRSWNDIAPRWEVDGFTRQRENEAGEYRQKDYSTGLTMLTACRKKKKAGGIIHV